MQLTDCQSAILTNLKNREGAGGEFLTLDTLVQSLPAHDASEIKRALYDLESNGFVALSDEGATITEMGIAALGSM